VSDLHLNNLCQNRAEDISAEVLELINEVFATLDEDRVDEEGSSID
jgi:hypothetical protein